MAVDSELRYTPLTNIDEVTHKLSGVAQKRPDQITDQDLFECAVDVVASRGGERWREIDEIYLSPNPTTKLFTGLYEPTELEPYFSAWIQVSPQSGANEHYGIHQEEETYQLYNEGFDDLTGEDEEKVVIPADNTALRTRLLQLLLDGQMYTPEESLEEDATS